MTVLRDELQRTLGSAYTLERELGGGGMSSVFVAQDNALGRRVVVKVLPYELAATVSVDRFKREIMLAAALQHPHIVPVLSAGETAPDDHEIGIRLPYFIMPFVEGESLRTRLARGPLSVREAVSIMKDVARALVYAHGRGIIHRDIKPDNILLASGSATVTDFGVAKALSASRERTGTSGDPNGITIVGTSIGTPAYMAPEQAAGDPATDHRADLYALGIVGYEMLVGTPPFHGRAPQQLLAAQLTELPPPINTRRYDVPEALASLIMRLLEKEPANRPRSAADVARALEDPSVVSGTFLSPPPRKNKGVRPRRVLWALAGAGILASIAAGSAWFSNHHSSSSPATTTQAGAAAPVVAGTKSIAVMPLVNISRDTSDAYFAAGMTAELTNALSRIPGLRVASATESAARDRAASPTDLAKSLGAGMVLVGTVQREGGKLRVTARLVNTADGFTVWSDMFERELKDVFAVQDEISSAIVAAISPGLALGPAPVADTAGNAPTRSASAGAKGSASTPGQAPATPAPAAPAQVTVARPLPPVLPGAPTTISATTARDSAGGGRGFSTIVMRRPSDVAAYDLFLRGQYYQKGKRSEASLRRALDSYEQAIHKDSNFARAFAGIGDVYALLPQYSRVRVDTLLPHALAAANRAVALDGSLPQGWMSRARLLQTSWRWADAEGDYRRVLSLDPNNASVHQAYGELLLLNRRTNEALAQLKRATELDALSSSAFGSYAMALAVAREPDAAVVAARRAMELDSSLVATRIMLGTVYLQAGRYGDGVRELEVAAALDTSSARTTGLLAYAYARSGMPDRARVLAGRLEADAGRRIGAASAAARAYLGLGDGQRAVVLLERAVADHDAFFSTESLAETFFDPLRGDRRFATIVSNLGLDRRLLTMTR
ncbi:MAG TPA: protein kinase [Gemmatimonadaceae bacterium]|nr:protein kinase [Gemmatimonadaceae bacterium]